MYGTSSGGQLVGAYCAGSTFDVMIDSVRDLVQTCANATNKCWGEVRDKMIPLLQVAIPEPQEDTDVPYPNCTNTYISVSDSRGNSTLCNLFGIGDDWSDVGNWSDFGLTGTASFISNFQNKTDLIDTIIATSYIPGFSGPECYVMLRGEPVVDGGFVANSFCLSDNCVKVNAFPPWFPPTQEVDIYPGIREQYLQTWPLNDLVKWSLARFLPEIVADHFDEILQYGRDDAEYWYKLQQGQRTQP